MGDLRDIINENAYEINAVLSGQRVSQMTKTYSDVEALQRLLEEKERDLELAARIGQQLLEQNQLLEERYSNLELVTKEQQDNITQLKHELHIKSQLLEIYNADSCNSEESSKVGTPISGVASVATLLEKRVALLEEENIHLRDETFRMAEDVEKTEAEEKYLVDNAIKKLAETNSRLNSISEEFHKKTEESIAQQEELAILVEEIKVYQEANKELLEDNLELQKLLEGFKHSQNLLTTELVDLKDNYLEVVAILKETQEQLREAQKQKESGADVVSVFESLAYEIESSVAKQRRASDFFRRTFDTVRTINNKIMDASLNNSLLNSSASSLGYHSELPSLDSSQDLVLHPFMTSISSSNLGSMCISNGSTPGDKYWKMPEKLQIVKPLEGSSTLQVWSSLATPHLGNLLDKRPGVKSRVERPIGDLGTHELLCLTGPDPCKTLISSTPTMITFVTTATNWGNETTTTVFSSNVSTSVSDSSLASVSSPTTSKGKELKCETPSNSPDAGTSRPGSPSKTIQDNNNRTFKTLFSVYETLCSSLGGLGSPSTRSIDFVGKPQKYDLMTKIGSMEFAFQGERSDGHQNIKRGKPKTSTLGSSTSFML